MDQKTNEIRWYTVMGDFVIINHSLLRKLGFTYSGILSELINQESKLINKSKIECGQPFYLTQTLLCKKIGISEDTYSRAIKKLSDMKLIKYEIAGFPPKNKYQINRGNIVDLIKSDIKEFQENQIPPMPAESGVPMSAFSGVLKPRENLNLERSLKPKDSSNLYSFKDGEISTQTPVEISGNDMTSLLTPSLIKRKKFSPIIFEKPPRQRYRKETLDIINYWNSSPGLPHHHTPTINEQGYGFPTKTFLKITSIIGKILDGGFFVAEGLTGNDKPYSKEEIISGIDKYKLIATNLNYLPVNKSVFKNLGLDTFFYNRFASTVKSQFLYCLENEPKPVTSVVKREEEKNPQLTQWIKDIYIEKILLGESKRFNNMEENKFIIGANHLHETMRRLQKRENMSTRPIEWCQILIDSLIASWGRDKIHPGHISSDYTYSDTLTRYLKTKGRID